MVLEIKDLKIQYKTDLEPSMMQSMASVWKWRRGETVGLVGETGAEQDHDRTGRYGTLPERTARIHRGKYLI